MLTIQLPYPDPLLSPNARPNRWALARAKKDARALARFTTRSEFPLRYTWGSSVTSIPYRVKAYPRTIRSRDDDNLIASLKASRDGIADALGVNDKVFKLVGAVEWMAPEKPGRVVIELEI